MSLEVFMISICTVVFLVYNPEHKMNQIVCVEDSLFNLLWVFDQADFVIAFEVSKDGVKMTNKDFGWGSFKKWVSEFTKEHFEKTY